MPSRVIALIHPLNAATLHDGARRGDEKVARFLAEQWQHLFAAPGLVDGRDELVQRQPQLWPRLRFVARPLNRAQASRLAAL